MSTRGIWGFAIDGEEKLTYNHFDSYPDGLGATLVNYLKRVIEADGLDVLREEARGIVMVTDEHPPTPEVVARLLPYADRGVSSGETDEWYVLLRNTQGDPRLTVQAGFMEDNGKGFAKDSLFCEWGYVIDLDDNTFEVYRGFVTEPHSDGRFASPDPADPEGRYFPIKLIKTYKLDELPNAQTFANEVGRLAYPEEYEEQ